MDGLMVQRTAEIVAAEINSIKNQTRNMIMYNSIEIGRRLTEAKTLVPHGSWGTWLEEKVEYSPRTAQNLMKIFEQYGSSQLSLLDNNIKTQAFADLSYTQALALLDIPEDEREAFVEENNVSDMSTRELQQAIKEKQQALQEKQEAEGRLKKEQEEKEKLAQKLAKAEKDKEKLAVMEEKLHKKEREAEELTEKYNRAVESLPDEDGDSEELESLRESLSEADKENRNLQKEITELKQQLQEQPIPAEAVKVEERVPEDVQDELDRLREEKAAVGFRVAFHACTDDFDRLLNELDKLEEQYKGKYSGATEKLLNKMLESL